MLDTITAAQLEQLDIPAPRQIVPKLITEGLNILAGAPKMGKSFLSLGIALAVANGGRALDNLQVAKPMPVLYLALRSEERRVGEGWEVSLWRGWDGERETDMIGAEWE